MLRCNVEVGSLRNKVESAAAYSVARVISIPGMQPGFATMVDCFLHLREGHAGYSTVDVRVGLGEGEGLDDGAAELIVGRERCLRLAPLKEENIRVEVGRAGCTGS